MRKGLLTLSFLIVVLFFGGCSYSPMSLRGSVGYGGEASTIPFSQEYYYDSTSPYDYGLAYPYDYAYPYPPYYYYYPYYYPYPYLFGGYYGYYSPRVRVFPAPGRRFRSSSSDGSPSSSGQPSTGERGFKR